MNIETAKYMIDTETRETLGIKAIIDGISSFVPIDPDNRHYRALMIQVSEGALTVEPMYTDQELDQMEAEAIAKEEAIEAIRASALRKLVENAGLTVEEVKSFINIEE